MTGFRHKPAMNKSDLSKMQALVRTETTGMSPLRDKTQQSARNRCDHSIENDHHNLSELN